MEKKNFMDYLNETGKTVSDEAKLRSWQKELMDHFNCSDGPSLCSACKGAGKTNYKHVVQALGRVSRHDNEKESFDSANELCMQIIGRHSRN